MTMSMTMIRSNYKSKYKSKSKYKYKSKSKSNYKYKYKSKSKSKSNYKSNYKYKSNYVISIDIQIKSIFLYKKIDKGGAFFKLIILLAASYMIYDKLTNKYTKLEKNFGGFMSRSLVRLEHENSPLHTIVYGGPVQERLILLDNI